jgi:hypothetical protein
MKQNYREAQKNNERWGTNRLGLLVGLYGFITIHHAL